jgi:hypothetical protein
MIIKLLVTLMALSAALVCASRAADMAASSPNASATTPAASPAADSDEAPWQFGVTIPLWAPQVNGDVTFRGNQQNVDISFSQLKDHLDASFAMGFEASKGNFGLYGDVGYMKFHGDFAGPLGGNTSADLKFVIADAGVSYLLVKTGEEHPFVLAGTAGLRYWYADTSLTFRGPRGILLLNGDKTWNIEDPVIGLRASQYLARKLHLDVSADIGGFDISNDTDITWSATGVVTYDFAKWFSLSAGYRALALDESNGSGSGKNGLNLIFNGALILAQFNF